MLDFYLRERERGHCYEQEHQATNPIKAKPMRMFVSRTHPPIHPSSPPGPAHLAKIARRFPSFSPKPATPSPLPPRATTLPKHTPAAARLLLLLLLPSIPPQHPVVTPTRKRPKKRGEVGGREGGSRDRLARSLASAPNLKP